MDELDGQDCTFERATLCAFDSTDSMDARVDFLGCMDSTNDKGCFWPGSDVCSVSIYGGCYNETSGIQGAMCFNQTALEQGAACAARTGGSISYAALEACYRGGRGAALLNASHAAWREAFPTSYSLPGVRVNGVGIAMDDYAYASIEKAMCLAGATAAVCKQQQQ